MNWNNPIKEEPVKIPEDMPVSEEVKYEAGMEWQNKAIIPEASQEGNAGWPEKVIAPEAVQEVNAEWPEKVIAPEAVQEVNTGWQNQVIPAEASHEEKLEEQKPAVVPEAAEKTQLTWLKSDEIEELKSRWNLIQIEFVDEPRKSVEKADALVSDVLKRIEQAFTDKRTTLDERWTKQEELSTEDLRIALQSYRSFFKRFLTI